MPTQKEIAVAAGVNRPTVRRALRGDAQISHEECERIQKLAREMGYRPNPMINALMAQVRTGKVPGMVLRPERIGSAAVDLLAVPRDIALAPGGRCAMVE